MLSRRASVCKMTHSTSLLTATNASCATARAVCASRCWQSRSQGECGGSEGEQRRQQRYGKLLHLSRQILNDPRRVMAEVEELGRVKRKRVEAMMEHLEQMSGRMKQVMEQTKARIFAGWTQMPGKLVSIFEPQTEIIRKGKASKPTEFGKLVQIQEAENQIITH